CILLDFRLTILHPFKSTLFPYTTLFRSPSRGCWVTSRPCSPTSWPTRNDSPLRAGPAHGGGAPGTAGGVERDVGGVPRRPVRARDRKSTRLNSSHRTISYAVFCLKKKKY